ncbi:FxLYD domain-containing protein [Halosimplex sp. TS25]|uniref:FxLYD domain-containing protein n=1 Tax=Halosimplex rarum TaxID=3396619 RepID=UPI0039E80483
MDRRTFLSLAAGLGTLGGCVGIESAGTDTPEPEPVAPTELDPTEQRSSTEATAATPSPTERRGRVETRTPTATEAPTPSPTPTEMSTPTPQPGDLTVVDTRLTDVEDMFGPDRYVCVDVENSTGNYHGYAEVDIVCRDADGETIDTDRVNVMAVPGNAVWRAYGEYHGDEEVDTVEAAVGEQDRIVPLSHPDGAEIVDSEEIETDILSNPDIEGTVEVREAYDYLEVLAPFYDEDGYFRAIGRANETYLEADTRWEFSAEAILDPPENAAPITDRDLVLTTGS